MNSWQPWFVPLLFAIALAFVIASLPPWVCPVPSSLLPPNPLSTGDRPLPPLPPHCLEFWANRYQGFVGGIFTLVAAAVAFAAVRRQVAQVDRIEAARLKQEALAARAVLPFALDAISDYAQRCLRELERHRGRPDTPLSLEAFPREAVPVLKEAVRFSEGNVRDQIADLIATAQVVVARSRGRLPASARVQLVLDLADLYERAGHLYEHGRFSMDRHRVSVEDIRRALRIARIDEEDWAFLTPMLAAREESERRSRG